MFTYGDCISSFAAAKEAHVSMSKMTLINNTIEVVKAADTMHNPYIYLSYCKLYEVWHIVLNDNCINYLWIWVLNDNDANIHVYIIRWITLFSNWGLQRDESANFLKGALVLILISWQSKIAFRFEATSVRCGHIADS